MAGVGRHLRLSFSGLGFPCPIMSIAHRVYTVVVLPNEVRREAQPLTLRVKSSSVVLQSHQVLAQWDEGSDENLLPLSFIKEWGQVVKMLPLPGNGPSIAGIGDVSVPCGRIELLVTYGGRAFLDYFLV